jgi:hypothetical protein
MSNHIRFAASKDCPCAILIVFGTLVGAYGKCSYHFDTSSDERQLNNEGQICRSIPTVSCACTSGVSCEERRESFVNAY